MGIKVGDLVITTEEHDGLPPGRTGKVMFMRPSTGTAAIQLDDYWRAAHSCSGYVSKATGWWVAFNKLQPHALDPFARSVQDYIRRELGNG